MSISVDENDGAPIKARSRLESRSTSEERSSKMYPPLKKKKNECVEEDGLLRKQNSNVCWDTAQSVGAQMGTEDSNGSGSTTAASSKTGITPKLLAEVTEISKGSHTSSVDDNNNNNNNNHAEDEDENGRLLDLEKRQEDKIETEIDDSDGKNSPVHPRDIVDPSQQYLQAYEIYARQQQSLQQQQQRQLINLQQDLQQDQQPIDCTQEAQCLTTRARPDEHRPDRYYGLEHQRLLHNPESVRDLETLQKQQIYGQETGLESEAQKLIEDQNECLGSDQMTSVEECSAENLSEQRNSNRVSELLAERAEQQQQYYILSPGQQQIYHQQQQQQQQHYEQQEQLYQQNQGLQAESQESRDQDQVYLQECSRKYTQEMLQLLQQQQKLQQLGEQQSYRLSQPQENDGRNDINDSLEQGVVNSEDALTQRHQLHRPQHYEQLVQQQEDQQNLAGQYLARALGSDSPEAENLVYLQQKNQLLCQLTQQQFQAASERDPNNIEVEQSFQELKPIDPNHFHSHYAVDPTSQQRTQQQTYTQQQQQLVQQFYLQQLGQQMNQQQQQQQLQTASLLQHQQQQQQQHHYQIQLTNLDQQQQQQYQQTSDHISVSKSLQQKILLQQAVQEARQVVKQHDQSLLLNQYHNSATGATSVLPTTLTLPGSALKKSGDIKSEDATAGKSNDEKVKRPMNAFMVWSRVERRRISQANPTMHNSDISKQLGGAWKAMPDTEKKVYIEESKRLRSELLANHPDYKYKPRRRRNAPTSGANTMVNIPANLLSSVVNIPSNILNTIADKGANNTGIVSNGNSGLLQNYNIQIPFSLSKSGQQQPLLSDSILQSLAMSSPRLGCSDSTISVPLHQLIASKHNDSIDSKKRHAASLQQQISRQSTQEDSSMHNYQLARLQQHLNPLNNEVESATAHLKNNAPVNNSYNSSAGVFLSGGSNKSQIDLLSLLKVQGLEELPTQASAANQYAQFLAGQRSQMASSPSYFLSSNHGLVNSSPSHLLTPNFTDCNNGNGIGSVNGSAAGHHYTPGLVGEPQSRVVAINYSLNKT